MKRDNKIEAMVQENGFIVSELWDKPEGVIITFKDPRELRIIDAWVNRNGDYVTKCLFDAEIKDDDLVGCISDIQRKLGNMIDTPYPIIIDCGLL